MRREHSEGVAGLPAQELTGEPLLQPADVGLLYDAVRQAEKRAALLTDVIEALSESRDTMSLLQRTVESVVRATDAGGAFVYLWDAELGSFVLRAATEGRQKAFVGKISVRPGEGLTGWSALMRRSVRLGQDLASDPRVVTFSELQEDEFRSCMIVPILIPGGDPVGVFSIYSVREEAFSEGDLRLVDDVAQLLASGIDRARVVDMWERQSAALESMVAFADSAPVEVTGILSELIRRVMAIVPSEVGIAEVLDVDGVTAGSVGLLARHPNSRTDSDDGAKPVFLPSSEVRKMVKEMSPAHHWVAIPMRLADRTVGMLTVHRGAPYSDADRSLLNALAGYGALAVARSMGRVQGESPLGQLVSATDSDDAGRILSRFGWPTGTWATPLVIRCDPELRMESARSLQSVTSTVEGVFADKWHRVVSSDQGMVAALIMFPESPLPDGEVGDWVSNTVTEALKDRGQSVGVAVGVGSCAQEALEIAHQFREAALALNCAAAAGAGVRLELASSGQLERELAAVGRRLAPEVADQLELVTRLRDYDASHKTELLATLEVFIRVQGSAQAASEELFIHRNTLRQRLNKISSLVGQPIESLSDWLPLLLAIRVLNPE